jgi:hypothetical protein
MTFGFLTTSPAPNRGVFVAVVEETPGWAVSFAGPGAEHPVMNVQAMMRMHRQERMKRGAYIVSIGHGSFLKSRYRSLFHGMVKERSGNRNEKKNGIVE